MNKLISNVKIYGIDESFAASKYPMSIDTSKISQDKTNTIVKLASSESGAGHDNFLLGIIVQFDLTFSNKAWVEAERYHFFDIVSSQSTMHRISKLGIEESCNKYVDKRIIEVCKELQNTYNETGDPEDYLTLLYNIPSGFCLTARMSTNYRQLKTIYNQRKNHRLPEWREFCSWCEDLPYFKEFFIDK